jgi:anion-transporting  ArsA/GET3 family ATPase
MDVVAFCRKSRVLVVAGKGGVGKTTMTAALARMAAKTGLSVLVVELEGKPGVSAAFGQSEVLRYDESLLVAPGSETGEPHISGSGSGAVPFPSTPSPSAPSPSTRSTRPEVTPIGASGSPGGSIRARRITPDDALLEYLADHGMKRISRRLVSSGALDVVATAIPGIRDILVLGKVKSLERQPAADLILVDAPATGHTMTFLSSAQGLLDAARSGPVRTQAADVVELLSDPDRCRVVLVTLPEEMPVNEVVEAAYALEDRIGVSLGPVIVNACLSADSRIDEDPEQAAAAVGVTLTAAQGDALRKAAAFRMSRFRLQEEQRARLAAALPLPQLQAPFLFRASIGPAELDRLALDLARGIELLAESGPDRRDGAVRDAPAPGPEPARPTGADDAHAAEPS